MYRCMYGLLPIGAYHFCNIHTHTHLTALFLGLPRWAGARKVKPIWILLKQETVSGSGISWAICKSASRSRQITMLVPHHSSFFAGRMPFLPPNQQRQSTEGNTSVIWVEVSIFSKHITSVICLLQMLTSTHMKLEMEIVCTWLAVD